MSCNTNQSCNNPLQAFLNLISPSSPESPTSPLDSATHNPTQPESFLQEPPSAVVPMVLLAHSAANRPESKPVAEQNPGWGLLVKALEALEAGTGIFPHLKTAVSELLACTAHVKSVGQNRKGYEQLASNLAGLMQIIRTYLQQSEPRWTPHSIENFARSISEQAAHIKRQQDRSSLDQTIRASDYEVDIIECYRRIEHIFRQLQVDISLSVWDLAHVQWVDTCMAKLNPADDARHNAALPREMERRDCTPNTRVKILKEAMDWSRKSDAAKIYWMNGMAGTGKTTIAYTLCKQLEESNQLGASFFCSRASRDCRNVNKIIPTIADQLAQFSNPYQNELCKVLGNNRDVAKREISVQFEKLIVGPLMKVRNAIPTDVIIVIDALDECEDIRGTQLVLKLLSRHATTIPFKLFVTSRPEPSISKILTSEDPHRQIFLLHEVEGPLVQIDIHTYLTYELRHIQVKPDDIQRLTDRAGHLFIFAATVVRYIDPDNPTINHSGRLSEMLAAPTEVEGKPYHKLDELYSAILSQALLDPEGNNREGQMRRVVIRAVIGAKEPLSIATLSELIGSESEEVVHRALLPLRSVLKVSTERVVSTLHASFLDFMLSADRSKAFYCDMSKQNSYMAARCFEIMKSLLKFNICNLPTSSQLDRDVPDLQAGIKEVISSGLSYACRYWGEHLYGADCSDGLTRMLDEFLLRRLLFWMETLNLKGWIGDGAGILLQALNSLPEYNGPTELRKMIQDCRSFVAAYAANPICQSTPHIYVSALPLAATRSFIRQAYYPRMKGSAHIGGTAVKDRGDPALATWSTGRRVSVLLLSRDGKRLASGELNGSVSVWDVNSGKRILGPLKKHQDAVCSLAFSPDGIRIASGALDSTICLWNAYTGDTLPGSFEGHTGQITDLIFSLDDTRLVSSCDDHTIRIWDSLMGVQIGPELTGHTASVTSIALTSDGKRLVSGSNDHTIRVWDLRTSKTVVGALGEYTDGDGSVSLSPDDKYIVSSCTDCTVRVWDIEKGQAVIVPLKGHTDQICCITFSPDGKRIASSSLDRTIRVWSSETGNLIAGPFHGHEEVAYSVQFSHDSTHIISGSGDGTICIWNTDHGVVGTRREVAGHGEGIPSIALSPDGTRLVSGSFDHTICFWETHDGTLTLGPLKGHTKEVWSVTYTPDGTRILSGSVDGTIRTWDAQTGLPLVDPFTAHTKSVFSIAVSPDGRLVISGSEDCSIKIWDLQAGTEVVKPPMKHSHWVVSVEFSPNGLYIASGSFDKSICVWDAETGELVRTLQQHTNAVTCVHFSPDSKRLVSGSLDQTVIMWDVDTGTVLSGPWEGPKEAIWAVAFSPDGSMVASGTEDGTICLWNVEKGITISPPIRGHTDWVRTIAFTSDNKRIITSSLDRTIRFWDLDRAQNTQDKTNSDWVMDEDGWVRDSESGLVLWLPHDLRRILRHPSCSFIIPEGSVELDFSNSIYGDRWRHCYDASTDCDHPGS